MICITGSLSALRVAVVKTLEARGATVFFVILILFFTSAQIVIKSKIELIVKSVLKVKKFDLEKIKGLKCAEKE